MQDELSALPGVADVSMSEIGALTGNDWSMTIRVDGYQAKEGEDLNPSVDGVGPRYFETMGIPLVSGREFTERDVKGAPTVAIINETMAKYFFNGTNPLGRRFGFGRGTPTDIEIVGVARDVRSLELREVAAALHLYPVRTGRKPHTADLLRPRRAGWRIDGDRHPAGRSAPRPRTCRSST